MSMRTDDNERLVESLDMSGIENKEFGPIPNGLYRLAVKKIVKTVKPSGVQYNFHLLVTDIISKNVKEDVIGRMVFLNASMSPTARWVLKAALLALGEDEDKVNSPNYLFDSDEWIDKEFIGRVTTKMFEGKKSNTVDAYNLQALSEEQLAKSM